MCVILHMVREEDMQITTLDQMIGAVAAKPRKRVVVAYGQDSHTLGAVSDAVDRGIVNATLVGDEKTIVAVCRELNIPPDKFQIVPVAEEMAAAVRAVDIVREGGADLIMKGLVSTDKYLRAILNKERGLVPPGAIISHVTVVEPPTYPKLIIAGDVAIIPQPDFNQKVAITKYLVHAAHSLGIEMPKVAVIAATEKVNAKMPACTDAALLTKMAERGQIPGCIIDGPLAIDLAIDPDSVAIKGVSTPIAGQADCLVFPNIESGNVFYKTCTKFAKAELGAIVVGTTKPVVLSSRGDSEMTKLYSLALAVLFS